MPELPEVEVSRQGIEPYLLNQEIEQIVVRCEKLRWPIPVAALKLAAGQTIRAITRRAKYLLIKLDTGTIVLHLGMSGSLRIVTAKQELKKHDHLDIVCRNQTILRYNDPRRFGACLWQPLGETLNVLAHLGPEPLEGDFTAKYLQQVLQTRKVSIKQALMNNKIVVGVGNIYANEALFLAAIDPRRAANSLSLIELECLVEKIIFVLQKSIKSGGTTLKDFNQVDGKPGYFVQELLVYGKANQACSRCKHKIESISLGQRKSFFCPNCQK